MSDPYECICAGNWRSIVADHEHLLDAELEDTNTGKRYRFFGFVHGADDYYYGMTEIMTGRTMLLSCVGDLLASWNMRLVQPTPIDPELIELLKLGDPKR